MARFRKRPVVIEAEQWWPGKHVAGVHEIVYCAEDGSTRSAGFGIVQTVEGPMRVEPGSWIIVGIKGERYACQPDVFEATYEPVGESAALAWVKAYGRPYKSNR